MELHRRVAGTIKLHHEHGYLIVENTDPKLPQNVMVPKSVLELVTDQRLTAGTPVVLGDVVLSNRGYSALRLVEITKPPELDWKPAIGKFFVENGGYGFAIPHHTPHDVFIHRTVLRASGLNIPTAQFPGTPLEVVIYDAPRGLCASAVRKPVIDRL